MLLPPYHRSRPSQSLHHVHEGPEDAKTLTPSYGLQSIPCVPYQIPRAFLFCILKAWIIPYRLYAPPEKHLFRQLCPYPLPYFRAVLLKIMVATTIKGRMIKLTMVGLELNLNITMMMAIISTILLIKPTNTPENNSLMVSGSFK